MYITRTEVLRACKFRGVRNRKGFGSGWVRPSRKETGSDATSKKKTETDPDPT